ncbi:DUF4337 domain-containing protein [Massilia horti]|uniref:DUF4337 domain-containing protein n=1 Tax=Massilia horti TaxID=2562153 RepID=A0A4Y9T6V3_9BURK|nr:DUF4337 domain-containing protein [Massilia horti]TFW34659.1 DUF4337 domain-containing protein [Massilia horti]
MELDPLETIDQANEAAREQESSRLNMLVAVTVALISTFGVICKLRDNSTVLDMQQAQASKIDHWAFYQARNIRQEVANASLLQLRLAAATAPAAAQAGYRNAIVAYEALLADQQKKKEELRTQAEQDQQAYEVASLRNDQFDLSEGFLAITIALLAVTSLTHQRWLYVLAMVPACLGVLMGLAGLFSWPLHPSWLTRLLS